MRIALALMTYGVLMLYEAQAETYTGETNLEEKVLKNANFMGPTQLKEVIAESLSVKGPFEFFNLIVEKDAKIEGPISKSENGQFGSLRIIGPFAAKNVICSDLDVIGPVDVTNLRVTGYANIVGPLKVNNGYFVNLDISADEIYLENIDVDHIVVKGKKDKTQVLHLRGKTEVKGDILFESGKGVIDSAPEVKILGDVKGATVEKKQDL